MLRQIEVWWCVHYNVRGGTYKQGNNNVVMCNFLGPSFFGGGGGGKP